MHEVTLVLNSYLCFGDVLDLPCFSRPDRLRDIADRFNVDHGAVLDNVLYARAYTSAPATPWNQRTFLWCKWTLVPVTLFLRRRTPDGAAGLCSRQVSWRGRRVQAAGEETFTPGPPPWPLRSGPRLTLLSFRLLTPSWRCSEWTSLAGGSWPSGSRNWPRCCPGCRKSLRVRSRSAFAEVSQGLRAQKRFQFFMKLLMVKKRHGEEPNLKP